ncbi:MAG: glycoside hydrolase family 3 C-terminal domain-containing protein, partial [Bacteroidaceae bacterium]|nr:glycoside hydrolase family 3 C-terminal domain-containing protein [Bacteroidaceae bacterium]
PCIYGVDQNHGVTYTLGGTLFPQNLSVAASFNKELPYEAAKITAYETKAGSCPWTYSPTLDLGRDPRWPRIWENYGEDCYMNAVMGSQAVRGFQGDDPNHVGKNSVAVSLKHFLGYGAPFTGKDRTPAYISTQDLREKQFAAYEAAIKAGALTVMVNSASVNGVPVHASKEWLTGWLKEGLNWDGMIVTDWADINNLYQREKVAKDKKDAIRIAINAGIDMSMDPYSTDFCTLLKELVQEGKVPMSRVDDAVRRVLRLKYRLNLFEKPTYKIKDYPLFGSKQHADVALHAAEESMVLLKNKNAILPLQKGKKILVAGPNANNMRCLNGGWSYTWQGHLADRFAGAYNTILEAMQNKFGKENVVYEPGVTYVPEGKYWEENKPEIEKAVEAAKGVDVVMVCIGENSYCETPGNLTDLTLSENQRNLVKALAKVGKPIVMILSEGRPRLIADIEPLAAAVVDIILPGNYGGDALANLLAGDVNFSGRLPFTYPREINSLNNYDYKVSEEVGTMEGAYDYDAKVSLQWPFGFGLSYTTFDYSNLRVDKQSFKAGDVLKVSVDVKNTGNVKGKDAVLLYSSDLMASTVPDNKRLRAFDKIELAPGESKTVSFNLKADDLAFVGYDGKWRLEEGEFELKVGKLKQKVNCTETKVFE